MQFRAPRGLVDRADALAAVFETDRTDILISALREYLRDAAHSDEVKQEIADASDEAAQAVLDPHATFEVRSVELDETFPPDDGENAAVTLANELGAVQLLCDEFDRLALAHVSLAETRLVTTPVLLTALVRNDVISPDAAEAFLTGMSDARSWSSNSYVERVKATLRQQRDSE